jgi:hypothetical protein
MRVLVVSDTHGTLPIDLSSFDVDAVIHAGDVGDNRFLSEFYIFDKFYVVAGNTDYSLDLPENICSEIEGIKFYLVHNLSAPHRIISSNYSRICECTPNLVVFGHTHTPLIEKKDDTIYLNPGSLGKKGLTGYRSYAIIEIDDSDIKKIEIIDVKNQSIIKTYENEN